VALAGKVDRARSAASASGPVTLELTADWDKKQFPQRAETVALRVTTPVPPDSWVRIDTDGQVPARAGLAVSRNVQSHTVQVEQTFFVQGVYCNTECDPDNGNPIQFRVPVKAIDFAAALQARDVTDPRRERPLVKSQPRNRESWESDESTAFTLQDAGFPAQSPASTAFRMPSLLWACTVT